MKPKIGQFVTADVDLPEAHPTRQGVFAGEDKLVGESGTIYKITKITRVVVDKNLRGSTKEFVEKWRVENIPST